MAPAPPVSETRARAGAETLELPHEAQLATLMNVRLTLTWIAGESPAGGKV